MLTLQKWPKGVLRVFVFLGLRSQEKATGEGPERHCGGAAMHRGRSLRHPGSLAFPLLSHSLTHYQPDLGLCP